MDERDHQQASEVATGYLFPELATTEQQPVFSDWKEPKRPLIRLLGGNEKELFEKMQRLCRYSNSIFCFRAQAKWYRSWRNHWDVHHDRDNSFPEGKALAGSATSRQAPSRILFPVPTRPPVHRGRNQHRIKTIDLEPLYQAMLDRKPVTYPWGETVDQTVGQTVDQTGSQTVDQTVGQTVDQTGSQTVDQTGSQTVGQKEEHLIGLSKNSSSSN